MEAQPEAFEVTEIEYSEDDILYYLVDEDGNEVGFVIDEDGTEVECYYEDYEGIEFELVEESEADLSSDAHPTPEPYIPEKSEEHGYLHKIMTIAGHEGSKARGKAEVKIDKMRDKAEVHVDKAKKVAADAAGKAKDAAGAAKAKAESNDLGITREGVKEATSDLNAIAKEGAETAKELKEAYDDIMENFGFLVPNKIRRRMP